MTPVLFIASVVIIIIMTAATLIAAIVSMNQQNDINSGLRNLSLFLLLHLAASFSQYYCRYIFINSLLLKVLGLLADTFYFGFIASWLHTIGAFAVCSSHRQIIKPRQIIVCIVFYGILAEGVILLSGHYHMESGTLYFNYDILTKSLTVLNAIFALAVTALGAASFFLAARSCERGIHRNGEMALSALLVLYMLWILTFDFISVNQATGTLTDLIVFDPIFVLFFFLDLAILIFLFKKAPFDLVLERPAPNREELIITFAEQFSLTKRETEVLACVYRGLNNPEIAETLFISDNTVKRHMNHIFQKTQTRSRYDLIAKVLS